MQRSSFSGNRNARQATLIALSQIENGNYLLETLYKLEEALKNLSIEAQRFTNEGNVKVENSVTETGKYFLQIDENFLKEIEVAIFNDIIQQSYQEMKRNEIKDSISGIANYSGLVGTVIEVDTVQPIKKVIITSLGDDSKVGQVVTHFTKNIITVTNSGSSREQFLWSAVLDKGEETGQEPSDNLSFSLVTDINHKLIALEKAYNLLKEYLFSLKDEIDEMRVNYEVMIEQNTQIIAEMKDIRAKLAVIDEIMIVDKERKDEINNEE